MTPNKELFVNQPRCPDLLIQKGDQIHLLNTKLARVPGVNPLTFQNLEEYTEYYKYQKSILSSLFIALSTSLGLIDLVHSNILLVPL